MQSAKKRAKADPSSRCTEKAEDISQYIPNKSCLGVGGTDEAGSGGQGLPLCPLRPKVGQAGYPSGNGEAGHETPVPPSPQYPPGFFARYCWRQLGSVGISTT
jgi:hypothetical protein